MANPAVPESPDQLDAQLTRLMQDTRRSIYAILAALGTLVLLLTGAVSWMLVLHNSNAAGIQAIREQAAARCAAGNAYRAGDEQAWEAFTRLITLPAGQQPEAAAVRRFLVYISQVDKQRLC